MALRGKFPCPSCGVDLRSPRIRRCPCGWPRPARPRAAVLALKPAKPIQYRLRTMLLVTTGGAVLFALMHRLGVIRFFQHVEAAAVLFCVGVLPLLLRLRRMRQYGFDDLCPLPTPTPQNGDSSAEGQHSRSMP